ncbi:MAG: chemotaxis-specific protein-glutamate methyltransferase CheB [Candidatus Binatia bacterium]
MNPHSHKVIKVLVVDDSQAVAEFLMHVLNADPSIQVVGIASNGEEGLEATLRTKPDVITMDIYMPKVNGFEATRTIMETRPTPIVIVSGSTSVDEVATNFRAMEAGALAVVARPPGLGHPDHEVQTKELVATVKLMSEVKVVKRWPRTKFRQARSNMPQVGAKTSPGAIQVAAIGASTGGPLVLQTILSNLSRDFAVPVLIVQHMTPGFVEGFVEWLAHSSGFPVRVATASETLLPGHAYVAPDDFHMGVSMDRRILLTREVKEHGTRPSVSFLFRSVKAVFGPHAVGVLLTGMGRDGAEELKALKDGGAITIAQDKESSVVHGMPGQAIQIGAAVQVLPPEAIAKILPTMVTKA